MTGLAFVIDLSFFVAHDAVHPSLAEKTTSNDQMYERFTNKLTWDNIVRLYRLTPVEAVRAALVAEHKEG